MISTSMLRSLSLNAIDVCCGERGDEAAHEFLGGQIEHAAPVVVGRARHRLQEMRLAEADGGVSVERIEQRMIAGARIGDAASGRIGELIGRTDQKGREGQSPIERRAAEILEHRRAALARA